MKKLVAVSLFLLVLSACASSNKDIKAPERPRTAVAACVDFTLVVCDKANECNEGFNVKGCRAFGVSYCSGEDFAAVSEHLDKDLLYSSCIPALESFTCEQANKSFPEECKKVFSQE